MKKRILVCQCFLILTAFSCDSDDDPVNRVNRLPNFTVIGTDDKDAFQFDFDEESQTGELTNITETEQIPREFRTIGFTEEVLSFYGFGTAWIKNTESKEVIVKENFFDTSNGELQYSSTNSKKHIFTSYFESNTSNNLYIRSQNISNSSIENIFINQADNVNSQLYFQNHLIISYFRSENQQNKYFVTVLNTDSNEIIKTLEFEQDVQLITTSDTGDLLLGTRSGTNRTDIKVYTLNTMVQKEEYVSDFFVYGTSTSRYNNGSLYYERILAQPSPIRYLPAIIDLKNNTSRDINILNGLTDYAQKNDVLNVSLVNSIVDFDTDILVASTIMRYPNSVTKIGIFSFDLNANMVSDLVIDKDFAPNYLFLR